MLFHVEILGPDGNTWRTDSSSRSKWNADTRCLELVNRGQFARVVDSAGREIVY